MTPQEIRQIIREELAAFFVGQAPQPKTPADIALQMARAGDVEASKRYLKSLSKRRAA